jgi:hypothetical protein
VFGFCRDIWSLTSSNHDLLFRWFVGLGIEDAEWDAASFTKEPRLAARRRYCRAVSRRGAVPGQSQKAAVELLLLSRRYADLDLDDLERAGSSIPEV